MIPPQSQTYDIVITNDGHILELEDYAEIIVNDCKKSDVEKDTERKEIVNEKRVSFKTIVSFSETMHHKDYTDEERQNCWYSKSDMCKIREEYSRTVGLMRSGRPFDPEQYCSRGLEKFLSKRKAMRKMCRSQAWTAVFREQSLQYYRGYCDVDLIAARYLPTSKFCSFEAYDAGLMDEIHVFNTECRESSKPLQ
mmetsp:Transcript_26113/g.39515  ORF Transcript_26113/g.39515 Transcript_26113/m.39515 type:complete len:195 (-) Transcript_26113:183-767(-)